MTKISGWIFMAIGAGVTLFSSYVQKRGGEGMALFFWAGIVMIGIGVFKIAYYFITRENTTKEEKKEMGNLGSNFKFGLNKDLDNITKDAAREKQDAINKIQQTNIIVCPVCGTKHYSNSNFCHMCGTRLK
jgi:hypothetical protein